MSERLIFFEPKSQIVPSTSIFAKVDDRTVLPSTIDPGGGGGEHKTTSGSHYLYIVTVDPDAETLKYHSGTGAISQAKDASTPPPPSRTG